MSIRFSCSCGRKLKVSDEKIGMKVLCSSCGATLKVPKKSQDEYWQDVPAKGDKPKVDYVGNLREIFVHIVPGAAVIILAVWGAYYLSSQIVVGRGNLPPLGSVSGTVKLDGKPLANATIRFIPLDDSGRMDRKGASAALGLTDDSGHYRLIYVKDIMGAAVGQSRVEIQARDDSGRDRVRREFNAQSTLQREVKSGSQVLDFDVHGVDSTASTSEAATQNPAP
jgi:hypothetical protein